MELCFFVGEGDAYIIEEFGGAIIVRIVGKEAIQTVETGVSLWSAASE